MPLPLLVGFISESVMTARYLPAGIGSKSVAGSTLFALKPFRLAMITSLLCSCRPAASGDPLVR